jgi:trimeric autotransporter adhesin
MKTICLVICCCCMAANLFAQPANDNPCAPATIPVVENADGCTPQNYTITGATYLSLTIPNACNNTNPDVWYKFSSSRTVVFLTVSGSVKMQLYTATACNGTFTQNTTAGCFNGGQLMLPVTPGTSYYMRISNTVNAPNFSFTACITTNYPSVNQRIGINTSNPQANLDVRGKSIFSDSATFLKSISFNGIHGALHIKGTTNTSQLIIEANSNQFNSNPLIALRDHNGADVLWIHSDNETNTFIGVSTGVYNNGGISNTFLGSQAGLYNTTGSQNTALGQKALSKNVDGVSNTATGSDALYSNTGGSYNTANGTSALNDNTTGYDNTAVGVAALLKNTTGNLNTAMGFQAMYYNGNGSYNTAIGVGTMYFNTNGYENTATGANALFKNTSGYYNTALGRSALNSNTSGHSNTATGTNALQGNTTGTFNTAAGRDALFTNTTGSYNTANGRFALVANTTGEQNTAMGDEALTNNSTGSFNTAIGLGSLYSTTTSANNTMLGCRAGYFNDLGWNNTLIGANSNTNASGIFNSIAVGESAAATANNQARIGNSSITSIGGFAGWTNVSDGRVKQNVQENVPGLSFINKLKPVTYRLNLDSVDSIMHKLPPKNINGKMIPAASWETDSRKAKEKIVYTGFIAQDVELAARELGFDFSGVDAAKNDKDLYGLRYSEFVVPLVKAVQEQQQQIELLIRLNKSLQKQVEELKAIVENKLIKQ